MRSLKCSGCFVRQRSLVRAIHVSVRHENKASSKGKGKATAQSLFAPMKKPSSPPRAQPTTPRPSPVATAHLPTHVSSPSSSRGWQQFESSWTWNTPPSTNTPKIQESEGITQVRTIFAKPLSFNPWIRILGAGFVAFVGFQWFRIPELPNPPTLWDAPIETSWGTRIWGTVKNLIYVQTPYWAFGGAVLSIWKLGKCLNIVTKLEQCKIRSSSNGNEDIYIKMTTGKSDILKRLSKEPRRINLKDIQISPIDGPHQQQGEMILNLNITSSVGRSFNDKKPYIIDTRYGKSLDKSDEPYVLSPSRLRHVFGRLEGK
ncbi:uncharacterized protein IL334_003950 [Kwoniella shivajii]|uniref:Mitochondrial protein n=1 Tax=Kwoniella shivajii TaxID=564305 RepID=A0ABZ1CZ06_9TREE|nr:hypothetical protein IL334_003950 [Kwoniella shivajii]